MLLAVFELFTNLIYCDHTRAVHRNRDFFGHGLVRVSSDAPRAADFFELALQSIAARTGSAFLSVSSAGGRMRVWFVCLFVGLFVLFVCCCCCCYPIFRINPLLFPLADLPERKKKSERRPQKSIVIPTTIDDPKMSFGQVYVVIIFVFVFICPSYFLFLFLCLFRFAAARSSKPSPSSRKRRITTSWKSCSHKR